MGAVGEDLQVDIHLADADNDTARRLAHDLILLFLKLYQLGNACPMLKLFGLTRAHEYQ